MYNCAKVEIRSSVLLQGQAASQRTVGLGQGTDKGQGITMIGIPLKILESSQIAPHSFTNNRSTFSSIIILEIKRNWK